MSTEVVTAEYTIPEGNLAGLRERVAELAKRGAKLGLEFPVRIVSEDHHHDDRIEHRDEETKELLYVEVRRYFTVVVESAMVKLDGWKFVASIAHTTEGNILSMAPGETAPVQYRDARSECDHCKTYRNRRETFVVRHDDGRTMQLGRSCLADFTGRTARDAQILANMAQHLGAFDAWCRDGGSEFNGSWDRSTALDSFLTLTAKVIRVKGWTSRTAAKEYPGLTATADDVAEALFGQGRTARDLRDKLGRTQPEDEELAAAAIAWATELETAPELNDYQHNLLVIARLGVVSARTFGLGASMIVGYQKAMDIFQRREKDAKLGETSTWQGTVGDRIRALDVTVVAFIPMPGGDWGPSYLVKFVDAAGNLFVTFSGSPQVGSSDVGTVVRIDGTVKRHETYDGVQQTTLSRVGTWTAEAIQAANDKAARKAARAAKRQPVQA